MPGLTPSDYVFRQQRRRVLGASSDLVGLDRVEVCAVHGRDWQLRLHLVPQENGPDVVLTPANIRLSLPGGAPDASVVRVGPVVETRDNGGFPRRHFDIAIRRPAAPSLNEEPSYSLEVVDVARFDPLLNGASFRFVLGPQLTALGGQ